MNEIVHLRPEETVRLDRDKLEVMVLQLGPAGADHMVNRAMEELAVLLARIERDNRAGRLDQVGRGVKSVMAIARQIGMASLDHVCLDVLELIGSSDGAAYCAALARLVRIGEGSLVAVWDLQDMSV